MNHLFNQSSLLFASKKDFLKLETNEILFGTVEDSLPSAEVRCLERLERLCEESAVDVEFASAE